MVEDRRIRFGAEYPLLLIFWLKLTQAAVARSLRQLSLSFILMHYQFPCGVLQTLSHRMTVIRAFPGVLYCSWTPLHKRTVTKHLSDRPPMDLCINIMLIQRSVVRLSVCHLAVSRKLRNEHVYSSTRQK